MTPSLNPAPDNRWLELLAAYVDDELDETTRETVERWLADHPDAKEMLRTQTAFSPNNWKLWRRLEPKMPTAVVWEKTVQAVAARVDAPYAPEPLHRPWVWVAGGIAIAATAAALLLAIRVPVPSPTPIPEVVQVDDPHAGVAVLPISTDADVDFLSVPGDAIERLPVGALPTAGKLVLATTDDVRLDEGESRMTSAPGDMPMIFAVKP